MGFKGRQIGVFCKETCGVTADYPGDKDIDLLTIGGHVTHGAIKHDTVGVGDGVAVAQARQTADVGDS